MIQDRKVSQCGHPTNCLSADARRRLRSAVASRIAKTYDVFRTQLNELGKRYRIETIAVGRWNTAQLARELEQDGIEMVAFGQGFASMTWPTKKLEKIVLSAKLAHGGKGQGTLRKPVSDLLDRHQDVV